MFLQPGNKSMMWIGEYRINSEDLDDEGTIGEAMTRYDSTFIMIDDTKYEPTESDRDLTFNQFMKLHGIDIAEIRETGMIHLCSICKKNVGPFSSSASRCKPCHAAYMRKWRKDKKLTANNNLDNIAIVELFNEVKTLRREIMRLLKVEIEMDAIRKEVTRIRNSIQ